MNHADPTSVKVSNSTLNDFTFSNNCTLYSKNKVERKQDVNSKWEQLSVKGLPRGTLYNNIGEACSKRN